MKNNNVVIGHHYWNRPSGGPLVCASTAYALEQLGFSPILTSTTDFDQRNYEKWFRIDLTRYTKQSWKLGLSRFDLYLKLLDWRPMLSAIRRWNAGLLFTDEVMYKPLLKHKAKMGFKIIEYVHFPYEVSMEPKFQGSGFSYGGESYMVERYGRFPMNMYLWGYRKLLPHYMRKNPFEAADLVLTNSSWTCNLAKLVYNDTPVILNPPLPPNVEVTASAGKYEKKDRTIIMLGRFTAEKRFHWVITDVMPRLVKEVPDVKLLILGAAITGPAHSYIERLKKLIEESGVKDAVLLLPDVTRDVIDITMDKSMVFLNATINETWGIVVAEAMARGLPVVIHKSGGAWTDIVREGSYGFGYESAEEATEIISRLLTDQVLWHRFSSASKERASDFTISSFTMKLNKLLDGL
ncbi:MAG: glycosyltransferase family 4 protein [Nitrososphaerota archaeon]|nr:glycosyltransferase family 4 protein [Nitrososphaerota archaeon]MDG7042778.1 glycosyltransferase family 4 protein [Nitrososphaerota archaeon]MDG7045374.1 glycosyltransferase family 4 protein [Nitrososphaerota archaeon]